jgi:hypothetical protein
MIATTSPIERHVMYALCNTRVKPWPYPHFYAENVFPPDFYPQILQHLNEKTQYSVASPFANRSFAREVDMPELQFLQRPCFMNAMINLFKEQFVERFPDGRASVYKDLRLVRDAQHYKIGPHTDARWKVLSLLFYLPPDAANAQYGTSIFTPRDPNFTCEGGPHHDFAQFDRVYTAPFVPNSCFGFWKTARSFHGVEPIPIPITRDVLLFNIYERGSFDATHKPPSEASEYT